MKSLPLASCISGSGSNVRLRLRLLLFMVCWYDNPAYAQQPYEANKQFNCYATNESSTLGYSCNGARNSCASYLAFRSSTSYQSPIQIARLLGAQASNISALNRVANVSLLPLDDLVLVPATCSCAAAVDGANYYQYTASYTLRFVSENYLDIANNTYEGLTTCQALIAQNPSHDSRNLTVGLQIDVPLRCACPTSGQKSRWGTKYLLSYLAIPGDNLNAIAAGFGVAVEAIVEANSLASESTTIFPYNTLLIPLADEPTVDQIALFNNPPPSPPAPPPPGSTGGSGGKGNGRTFIGVGVGVAVAVVLGALLSIWWFRRRRRLAAPLPVSDVDRSGSPSSSFPLNSGESIVKKLGSFPADQIMAQSIREAIESLKVYEFHELEKATGSFSEDRRIKGASTVYKGSINGDEAAIKRLRSMGDFTNEITVLKQINHSGVIRLSGFCLHEGNAYLVYEYAEKGSLDDWLRQDHNNGGSHRLLSWKQRIQIAHDIADALNYLHNYSHPPYVHLNLNSSNVLLDAGNRAKLANFALARAVAGDEEDEEERAAPLTRHVKGTHGYMSPEYLQDGVITPKVDVFAFGVVLLELMSGREAAGEKKKESSILSESIEPVLSGEDARSKLRDFIDPCVRDDYSLSSAFAMAELAVKCVARGPGSRPSMTEVLLSISALYDSAMDLDSSDFTNSSSMGAWKLN